MKTKKEDVPPIPEPLAHNYHADNWQEVVKDFDGHYPSGLKDSEVSAKLTAYGFNEMLLKSTPKWLIFLKQFNNVIIYILIVAALLTLLMRHYSDATVIGLVVIINALIGYFQEINASNALEKIKNMLSVEATVIRNNNRFDIPSRNLVPGDLVYLEAGDNVPADLRILDADNLRIQESSLTGEADSVLKSSTSVAIETPLAERANMAYATTAVTNGSA